MKPASNQGPRLTFLGTGNAFNEGAKGNQALLLEGAGCRWLIDCGPTTVLQMRRFGHDLGELDGIVLTHLHADHALGVPMVLLALNFLHPRTAPLHVVGPPGTQAWVEAVWQLAYPDVARKGLVYELAHHALDGTRRDSLTLGPLRIDSLPMSHSVPVNGYRLALGGRLLAVSGDTGPGGDLAELGGGADLLVVECNSLRPLPRVTHMSVEDHRGALPYGADRVALVHGGGDVVAAAARIAREHQVLVPADGESVDL